MVRTAKHFLILFAVAVTACLGADTVAAAPGDLDATWTACGNTTGTACSGTNGLDYDVYGLGVDANGSIRASVGANTYNGQNSGGRFKRFASDGTLASGWPTVAGFTGSSYASVYDAVNDRTYVVGDFSSYNNGSSVQRDFVARLDGTGALETSWQGCYLNDCAANNGLNTNAYAVALDSSNVPIVGGGFGGYNFGSSPSSYVAGIVKLVAGDIASGWVCRGGITASTAVRAIAVQADGKIIIGGNFTDYGNQAGVGTGCVAGAAGTRVTRSLIARLNADGSLDTTWTACGAVAGTACTGTNGFLTTGVSIRALKLQPDGKLLVGGTFTQFNGSAANYVMRLNADGTRDTSFMASPAIGASGAVNSIDLNPTGRIYIGGAFNFVNGSTCRKVARLLEDGTLDPSFTCAFASGDGDVNAVAYDSTSRRLYVGGAFTAIGGVTRSRLAALSGVSAPSAPLSPSATAGEREATVSWSTPASSDGLAVTGYTVTGSPGGTCTTTSATTCTITGLTAGTQYTFTVTATSSAGVGVASAATAAVTPTAAAPGAPGQPTATAGDGSVAVSWSVPASDGGATITGYTVTGSPNGACTTTGATTCTITGLANGVAHTFTVTATNSAGTSSPSAASAAVTPASSASGSGASDTSGGGTSTRTPAFVGTPQTSASGVVLRVRVPSAGVVRIRGVRLARSLGVGGLVCTGSRTAATASTVAVDCRLTTAGRRTLAQVPLRVRLTVTFTAKGGGSAASSRSVVLPRVGPAPTPVPSVVTG